MKRRTVIIPTALPKISAHAAVQLMNILQQLKPTAHHHYAPQIQRWQRQRRPLDDLTPRSQKPKSQDDLVF